MDAVIDTLQIYKRLKDANLNDDVANEIAEVFKDITESVLPKKADVDRVQFVLKIDIEKVKAELRAEIDKVQLSIERSKVDTIKWVAAMLAAQAGVIAALVWLLSN
ncbi:MAG: hypothetical protein HQL06_06865 [Nitrospirae bacterium]|nr:hypothetical protein [Nitrospirota bacterium]